MHVLILGASGFLGRHLASALLDLGADVEGWSRRPPPAVAQGGRRTTRDGYRAVDLAAPESYASLRGPWDAAVFLAGQSVPGAKWDAREVERNVALWTNALDHLARVRAGMRVVLMSSARVYAPVSAPSAAPLREDDAIGPTGAYGLAKEICEAWGRFRARDLDVQIARPFNQIGPGMPRGLLVPDLLDAIGSGSGAVALRGGDSRIDLLDARDGARAIAGLVTVRAPSASAWNVCSGTPRSVSELARGLMQRRGIDRPLTFAAAPPTPLCGCPDKIAAATGWKPRHSFEETLDWILAATPAPGGASA